MTSHKIDTPAIKKAYNNTVNSVKNNPALFTPFLILATLEVIALIILYLAPRMPLRIIFGPIIRTLWSEAFLHYPANFLLLPKLSSLANMGLSIIFGSLLTGMAVIMIRDAYHKKEVRSDVAFKSALKEYISLFIIVFILILCFYASLKIATIGLSRYFLAGHSRLLFFKAGLWMGPILTLINLLLALFIQSCLIYAIPILIIEKAKVFPAIARSLILFKKLFIPTLILVGLPMLIYVPIIILNYNTSFLMNKVFPEFIFIVTFLGIVISCLAVDLLVTVSTTLFYLTNKE